MRMKVTWTDVEMAFRNALPPDALPPAAWERLYKLKDGLKKLGLEEDFLDKLSEDGVLTTPRMLVAHWFDQWDQAHPEKADAIQRYEELSIEYHMQGNATLEDALQEDVTADEILEDIIREKAFIEAAEPGLDHRRTVATIQRENHTARLMNTFLAENGIPTPVELTAYIEFHKGPGKEN